MFIRNSWYVLAWDHEIPDHGLFARTVLGEPLVAYRTTRGELVAMEDRCCHRLAPLSKGRHEGDCVRCGYHGLKFDASGQCVEVPGMAGVPGRLKVRTYPLRLHRRWVFVWMGDPARADDTLLPDNHSNEHPDWVNRPGYMHYEVPYLLICDNLLDFSHLSYVHERTLGGSPEIARARPEITKVMLPDGRQAGVRVARHVPKVPPPAYWKNFRPGIAGLFDRWFIYDFMLPGTLLMESGGHASDAGAVTGEPEVRLHSCQTLTPETETSTHYFFQQSCRTSDLVRAPDTAERMYQTLLQAFNEDRDMISAQYRAIAAAPGAPMIPLHFDAALIEYRRLVRRWLDDEAPADLAGRA